MRGIKTRKTQKKSVGSSRFQKRRRRVFILKIISSFALLGLFGYGLFSVSHARTFAIATVEVDGAKLVPKSSVVGTANASLAGAYAWIFPKKNVFLAPRNEIEETLKQDHPEFTDVSVETEGLRTMKIEVTERAPEALWCDGTEDAILAKKSECYFADATGFIFASAPTYSGNAMPTFGGHLESSTVIGQRILSERDFAVLRDFVKNLSVLNITPAFLYINPNNEYDIVLTNSGKIIFSGTSDPLVLSENLKSIIEEQGNAVDRQHFIDNLDYIDLRFGNKVYYKLK